MTSLHLERVAVQTLQGTAMSSVQRVRSQTLTDPLTGKVEFKMNRDYYVEKPCVPPLPDHPMSFNSVKYVREKTVVSGPYAHIMRDAWPDVSGITRQGTATTDSASLLARNKCLEELQGSFGEQAMLAVNIVERKTAYNALVNRSLQLVGMARAIRRGDLKGLASALLTSPAELERARKGSSKVRRKGSWRSRSKDVSATWLEYHFGWEPLVKDIYRSVEIMQSPYDPVKLVVRRRAKNDITDGNRSTVNRWRLDEKRKFGWRLSAELQIDNPNLFRANQLGLVNPASIAWELVPFSFVVDWFLPVGAFLNSWTAFAGVTVTKPLTTCLEVTEMIYETYWKGAGSSGRYHFTNAFCQRSLSLPPYSLRLKAFKGFSVTRGATAIALLVNLLGSKPR